MAAHIEKLVLGCLLGLEFLMNIQVNTLRQKIKAPQLWSIHSIHSGQHSDQPHGSCHDLWWVCGCGVALSAGDCYPSWWCSEWQHRFWRQRNKQTGFFFFFKHKHNKLFGTHIVASPHTGFLGRWATFWLHFAFLLLPQREHHWVVQVMFTAVQHTWIST